MERYADKSRSYKDSVERGDRLMANIRKGLAIALPLVIGGFWVGSKYAGQDALDEKRKALEEKYRKADQDHKAFVLDNFSDSAVVWDSALVLEKQSKNIRLQLGRFLPSFLESDRRDLLDASDEMDARAVDFKYYYLKESERRKKLQSSAK